MGRKSNTTEVEKKKTNQDNMAKVVNGNKKMESSSNAQVNGNTDKKKEVDKKNINASSEDHLKQDESTWTANVKKKGKGIKKENAKDQKGEAKNVVNSNKDVTTNTNKDTTETTKKDLKKEMKAKEEERKKMEKEIMNAYEQLTDIENVSDVRKLMEAEEKLKKKVEQVISTINIAISKATSGTPKPTNVKMTSVELQSKLKEAKLKKKKINSKHVDEIEEANTYINYLEEQLNLTKNYETIKIYISRLNNIKKLCDEKLKENEKRVGDPKQLRKLRAVERIIKTKKEKQNIEVQESDIIRKEYSMPLEHHNSIVKPYNFFNRIIVKYFVFVEKEIIPNADRINLTVVGCSNDVDGFINHLKNIDFTEKNSARVGYQVIKNILSLYEGSFRSMELDNDVFVQADKEMIYYCGMKQNVEKFKEVINKAIAMHEKSSSNKTHTKTVVLDPVLSRGFNKVILKEIENDTNTLIKITYDDKKNEATAIIKGNKQNDLEEAEKKLNRIFESLNMRFMELDEGTLSALYKRCKYDLNDIRNELGLFIIRHKNGISLVGKEENIGKAVDIINNAKNSILSKTVRKKVSEEDSYLFNANYRNYIKNETGATVKIFNKSDHKELHISGTSECIDKALNIIEELLENKKCVEVEISEKTVAFLLSGKAQKIKEIEMDTSTSIQINKNERVAQIYGHEDKIYLAKDILEQLVLDEKEGAVGNYNTKDSYEEVVELSVDAENIGIIIGRRGQTINKIQDETYVNKIHVDKEKKKVYIYGSKRAVALAKDKVLEIMKRGKNQEGTYSHPDRADVYNRSSRNYRDSSPSHKKGGRSATNKTGRSGNRTETAKNGICINTNDEEAFPSLQNIFVASPKKSKKTASQNNMKRQDETQVEANVAE